MTQYMHNKTGNVYQKIGTATLQTASPIEDYAMLVVYVSEHNGVLWARPIEEFNDGRFTQLTMNDREDKHLYRKRPVVIAAYQMTEGNRNNKDDWPSWLLDAMDSAKAASRFVYNGPQHMHIETLEGTMEVGTDDWIIRGVAGELYPCKPDIFAATYEEAK